MPTQDTVFAVSAATAALAIIGLSIAQSDAASRRLLGPQRLDAKRRQEYTYRWSQSIDKALLRAHYFIQGGVDATASQVASSTIWDEDELRTLIQEWISLDKQQQKESKQKATKSSAASPFPRLMGISREADHREILLECYHPHSGTFQIPLVKFGMLLADIMENTVTTTTLCFVADASSDLGSELVADMLEASKAGVAIIREPTWMTAFAKLTTERVVAKDKLERVLFGLCRMEAMRVREQIGEVQTVLITLPGQTVTPVLLPMLQSVFPEDRHVFAYDSCQASVERAIFLRKQYRRATLPTTLENALSFTSDAKSSDPTRITTPMTGSLIRSIRTLASSLSELRLYCADTVESWMASVDAFFKLKGEENTTGYLPYTLKLGLLLDDPSGSLEPESERHYSVSSLMQFITGARSTSVPPGVMDAAVEWLRDYALEHQKTVQQQTCLSGAEKKSIENCVFQHKLILIGDKTLKDTVLPTKHWTLKQAARKGGCACCAPEEDDEEEETNTTMKFATGISRDVGDDGNGRSNNYVDGKTAPPKYVDGKMGFAFDPTKFS